MERKKQVRQKAWAVILAISLVMSGLVPGIPGKAEAAEIPLKIDKADPDGDETIASGSEHQLAVGEAMVVYVENPDSGLNYALTHDGTVEQVGTEDVEAGKWKITAKTIITEPVNVTITDNSEPVNSTSFKITAKEDITNNEKLTFDVTAEPEGSNVDVTKLTITWSGFSDISNALEGEKVKFTIKDKGGNALTSPSPYEATITGGAAECTVDKVDKFLGAVTIEAVLEENDSYVAKKKLTTEAYKQNCSLTFEDGSTEKSIDDIKYASDTDYSVPTIAATTIQGRELVYTLDNKNSNGQPVIEWNDTAKTFRAVNAGTATITITAKGNELYTGDAEGVVYTVTVVSNEVTLSDFSWQTEASRVYNGEDTMELSGTLDSYTISLPVILDSKDAGTRSIKTINAFDENGEPLYKITDGTNTGNYVLKEDPLNSGDINTSIKIDERPIYLGTKDVPNKDVPNEITYGKENLTNKISGMKKELVKVVEKEDSGILGSEKDEIIINWDNAEIGVENDPSNIGSHTDVIKIVALPTLVDNNGQANTADINNYELINLAASDNDPNDSGDIGNLTIEQDKPELLTILEEINFTVGNNSIYPKQITKSGFWIKGGKDGILKATINKEGAFDSKGGIEYYNKVVFNGEDLTNDGYDASAVASDKIDGKILISDDTTPNPNTTAERDFFFFVDNEAPTVEFKDPLPSGIYGAFDITFGMLRNKVYEQDFTITEPTIGEDKDPGSGIASVQYYVWHMGKDIKDADLTAAKVKAKADGLKENDWKSVEVSSEKSLTADVKIGEGNQAVFVKVIDNVGNEAIYVSNGVVIEGNKPAIELDIEEKEYYTANIPYTVTVNDAFDYMTAIDEVDIKVTNRDKKTAGDSENFANIDKDSNNNNNIEYSIKNLSSYSEKVIDKKITAKNNNSNNVKLKITAIDNAGNETAFTKSMKIDITKPEIAVSYDNNSVTNEKYFTGNRNMTIVFTERNFSKNKVTFDVKSGPDISEQSVKKNVNVSDLGKYGIDARWISDSESNLNESSYTDDRTNTLKLTFNQDNEYYIVPHCVDKAGLKNSGISYKTGTKAAREFVIDKTKPEIKVSFDNNNSTNEYYYDAPRTATITVEEHNFHRDDIEIEVKASHQTERVSAPAVSGWTTRGDTHTATIPFNKDGDYEFTIKYNDRAGNEARVHKEDKFVVDQTKPEIEFFDIVNMSANNGTVAPGVSYMDVNYDTNGVNINITGTTAEHGTVGVDGTRTTNTHGESIKMADFAHDPDVDDVYTMTAEIRDKAGNSHQDSVTFSVNRFGSNFIFSEDTKGFLNKYYNNEEQDLVVTEVNVDTLEHRNISYGRDGEMKQLKEGKDYQVRASGSEVSWKSYRYTIPAEEFETEGHYSVTIDSRDRATNEVNNKIKEAEIDFVIDKTKPTVVLTGVEAKKNYTDTSRNITIAVEDNVATGTVEMYVNGQVAEKFTADVVAEYKGQVPYKVKGTGKRQDLHAVAYDAAGNLGESKVVEGVLISKNFFIRIIQTPWMLISILAALAAIGALIFFQQKRRKADVK